ncbi:hypothetical protein D3C81_792970 [compost metagenome]
MPSGSNGAFGAMSSPVALTNFSPTASRSTIWTSPVTARGPRLATVMVDVIMLSRFGWPTVHTGTSTGALLLAIARSAPSGRTCRLVLPELLPGSGSSTLETTVAVLVTMPTLLGPVVGTCAVTLISTGPALADNEGTAQSSCVPSGFAPQVQPAGAGATPTITNPAGIASVSVTLVAALGPLLRTRRVKVTSSPAATIEGSGVFSRVRSAPAVTVVAAELLLSSVAGSIGWPAPVFTSAGFSTVPLSALTFARNV